MGDYFDPEPAFTTGGARRAGFTRRDIDADFLDRPFHGLRSAGAHVGADDAARAEQQRIAIRRKALQFHTYMASHEFFSHTTAAVLWGIPLPLLPDDEIHVAVLPPHRGPRGKGVRGHQLATRGVTITTREEQGLRVTSAAVTWALLGAVLPHPYDLVAAADSVVRVDRVPGPKGRIVAPALGTVAEMRSALLPKRRGVVAQREALTRARGGVASRPETWTRLTIVDAGLPEPETDVDVYDDSGEFIGCVDLAYRLLKIAFEYEGDHHRTEKDQWYRDLEKHEALARSGWRVIRVTARMVFVEPHILIGLARQALHERA
ncbi:hypothetical protein JNB62_08650 [Microbacterium jejuense]|uniref:DUF559 domain-containing protein n=1 Tax=Microbacterium jejuense TaxID=1263637 RepID=A0ABS7HMW9_9MICO|nr:hypothetical protein [Microbacterium jejuense]MBW9093749.1 hypothetical protein [Microbacterium jejuense]